MRIKSLAVLAGLLVFQTGAWAIGTSSGTTVTNVARVTFLANGSVGDTITGTLDTTVGHVGGDTLSAEADQSMGPNDTRVFTYTFANTGNASDTFDLWIDTFLLSGGAQNWTFTFYAGGQQTSSINDTKVSAVIAADGNYSCSVAVWANNLIANSPDGSFAEFKLVIASGLKPTASAYVGDNGITYSLGGAVNNDIARASVAAATITLQKVITSITTGAVASMPKPGATILYTLTYQNSGTAAGDSVVVRDSIPANCVWDTASREGDPYGATATLVDGDSGATGWQLQVSTDAVPADQGYYSADYQSIAGFAGAKSTVRWIRWRRLSVAPIGATTLVFRVIIQ